MAERRLSQVVHTKPADTAVLAAYEPDAREVEALVASLDADLPALMPALGLPDVPAPLLWTVELVLGDADDRTRCVGHEGVAGPVRWASEAS